MKWISRLLFEDKKFTYCRADKLKIIDNQTCPADTECVRDANNTCTNNSKV